MARIVIESTDGRTRVELREDGSGAYGYCAQHDEILTDRGHFEDTCEAIANHIENEYRGDETDERLPHP